MPTKHIAAAIVAMVCLTALELMAMYKGLDGMMFTTIAVMVAALGGVAIDQVYNIIKKP